ncbi:sigma-70 family RNA polymerase sigma factor [Clostridium saccharobutylicum]|uniref:RNA polymerase sigma factor SigX n=1 Tax=Clostridium saccharobutylicum TaxID=169679 RepID=A0A1S8MQN9_CLOSA|nr:sigma-70 family RNA polymerase sigma factor [Clostridium saccharobutylicum]OOM06478.1 RNA polymerase sigma factor SigX [Clostridium saccharobutylicum]
MQQVTTIDFSGKEKKADEDIDKKEEFTEIFELYYKRIYNYTYYRVNSREAAEDLTSQIFEKVMFKLNTYLNEKSKFEVWMFTIARNTINDYYRKQKKHKIISLDSILDLISKDKGPEELMVNRERNNKLINALKILDPKERNIIAYKFGADLKNKEIAKILNISESNIGVKLHRIMKKLKNEMEKEAK